MEKRICELSMAIVSTDLHILLEEIKDLKANLALELDFARDRRLQQESEFQELISELRQTLAKIQAQFRIEAQLLNLIREPKAGDHNEKKERGATGAQEKTSRVSSYRQ